MVLIPWEEKQIIQGSGSVMLFDAATMQTDQGTMHLTQAESSGRWRFDTKHPVGPTIGYEYLLLSMSGNHAPIPGTLVNLSAGAGTPFMQTNGWFFMAGGGAGYAGDEPFGNGEAWYGRGWLVSGRELDATSQLIFLVDYNGNRAIWPDVPIPSGIYHKKVNDQFEFTLGPVMEAIWKPVDRLTVDVRYEVPETVDLLARYELNRNWSVYASLVSREYPFHTIDLPDNKRLFLRQNRAEAGVHFAPTKWGKLIVAGGYAFGQEWRTGWDVQDLQHVSNMSDEMYLRVGIELSF